MSKMYKIIKKASKGHFNSHTGHSWKITSAYTCIYSSFWKRTTQDRGAERGYSSQVIWCQSATGFPQSLAAKRPVFISLPLSGLQIAP